MKTFGRRGYSVFAIFLAVGAIFLLMAGALVPEVVAAILYEDFEDGTLDPRISIMTEGSFNSSPDIKDITNFDSLKAFGFGRSQCDASCFHYYMTTMKIEFPSPTFVSTLSFKEMELYGNWGSGGKIFIDGEGLTGEDFYETNSHNFGRLPYNDGQADSTYRIKTFQINQYVSTIEFKVWDITSSSEIFIDDLLIVGECTPPPSGMVSWWGGDNNALDIIGTNHGTLINGVTYAPGMVGQAFSFDGVNDYVEMVGNIGDLGSNPFTIDFWMYSNNSGNSAYIMGKSHPDGGQGWDIRLNNGKIRLEGTDGWAPAYNWESNGTITPNTWHHIAISATTDSIAVYINGILDGTTTRSTISSTSNPFRIGFTTNYGGTPFNGLIDEIEIFDRALAANEIATIYSAGSAGKCRPCTPPPSGIISWWKAENNGNDSVGPNHGTLRNGATFTLGKVGQSFSFDRIDDYITTPDSSNWDFGAGDFTIEGWINTNTPNVIMRLISAGSEGDGAYNLWAFGYGAHPLWGTGNRLNFAIYNDSDYPYTDLNSDEIIILPNTWYHIAVVRTGDNLMFYFNGAQVGSQRLGTISLGGGSTGAIIGARYYSNPSNIIEFANGFIDEVSIYNRALTADEIAAIFNAGNAGKCQISQSTLTVTRGGTGTGNVEATGCTLEWGGDIGSCVVNHGTTITLSATASEGSTFSNWCGDCGGTNPTTQVTINEAKNCTAVFVLHSPIINPTVKFDDDQKSDPTIYRASTGAWYILPSTGGTPYGIGWGGEEGDLPVAGDYDGDGKTDIAVYRSSTGAWYIYPSGGTSPYGLGWGGDPTDKPAPGDYDGDGKTDIAVYRGENGGWYIIPSGGVCAYGLGWGGESSDIPVPGDYDGDGKTDLAVYRGDTGAWYIMPSSGASPYGLGWGGDESDLPSPGDYDGDGKTDVAVYRVSIGAWFVIPSSEESPYSVGWGGDLTDRPAPGDYDGDGKIDITVYRGTTGAWYVIPSSGDTPFGFGWGGDASDVPVTLNPTLIEN